MLTNTNKMYSESTDLRQGVQPQPELIRNSNPNFWIHPGSDLDVCRIAPKMLWIRYYLVGVSHFAECRKNRPMTVSEMLINLLKSFILQWRGKWIVWNPYAGPDHYQTLISSSRLVSLRS